MSIERGLQARAFVNDIFTMTCSLMRYIYPIIMEFDRRQALGKGLFELSLFRRPPQPREVKAGVGSEPFSRR